jgi:hypothetical protein
LAFHSDSFSLKKKNKKTHTKNMLTEKHIEIASRAALQVFKGDVAKVLEFFAGPQNDTNKRPREDETQEQLEERRRKWANFEFEGAGPPKGENELDGARTLFKLIYGPPADDLMIAMEAFFVAYDTVEGFDYDALIMKERETNVEKFIAELVGDKKTNKSGRTVAEVRKIMNNKVSLDYYALRKADQNLITDDTLAVAILFVTGDLLLPGKYAQVFRSMEDRLERFNLSKVQPDSKKARVAQVDEAEEQVISGNDLGQLILPFCDMLSTEVSTEPSDQFRAVLDVIRPPGADQYRDNPLWHQFFEDLKSHATSVASMPTFEEQKAVFQRLRNSTGYEIAIANAINENMRVNSMPLAVAVYHLITGNDQADFPSIELGARVDPIAARVVEWYLENHEFNEEDDEDQSDEAEESVIDSDEEEQSGVPQTQQLSILGRGSPSASSFSSDDDDDDTPSRRGNPLSNMLPIGRGDADPSSPGGGRATPPSDADEAFQAWQDPYSPEDIFGGPTGEEEEEEARSTLTYEQAVPYLRLLQFERTVNLTGEKRRTSSFNDRADAINVDRNEFPTFLEKFKSEEKKNTTDFRLPRRKKMAAVYKSLRTPRTKSPHSPPTFHDAVKLELANYKKYDENGGIDKTLDKKQALKTLTHEEKGQVSNKTISRDNIAKGAVFAYVSANNLWKKKKVASKTNPTVITPEQQRAIREILKPFALMARNLAVPSRAEQLKFIKQIVPALDDPRREGTQQDNFSNLKKEANEHPERFELPRFEQQVWFYNLVSNWTGLPGDSRVYAQHIKRAIENQTMLDDDDSDNLEAWSAIVGDALQWDKVDAARSANVDAIAVDVVDIAKARDGVPRQVGETQYATSLPPDDTETRYEQSLIEIVRALGRDFITRNVRGLENFSKSDISRALDQADASAAGVHKFDERNLVILKDAIEYAAKEIKPPSAVKTIKDFALALRLPGGSENTNWLRIAYDNWKRIPRRSPSEELLSPVDGISNRKTIHSWDNGDPTVASTFDAFNKTYDARTGPETVNLVSDSESDTAPRTVPKQQGKLDWGKDELRPYMLMFLNESKVKNGATTENVLSAIKNGLSIPTTATVAKVETFLPYKKGAEKDYLEGRLSLPKFEKQEKVFNALRGNDAVYAHKIAFALERLRPKGSTNFEIFEEITGTEPGRVASFDTFAESDTNPDVIAFTVVDLYLKKKHGRDRTVPLDVGIFGTVREPQKPKAAVKPAAVDFGVLDELWE